ncbi:unnamed protein product [Schistosoma margrebowiei]|uniref:Uncharacterized protein n=1 Tax=Schistosoma margrebowiei TaxID=48269 RepID=A0A183MI83_9TREM|nr:unnamed protein product [Schistosoma margrebowiei]
MSKQYYCMGWKIGELRNISSRRYRCLLVHKGKTKVLKFKVENSNPITHDGETQEEVESYTYMGSIIDQQGGLDTDVKARVDKARVAFLQLKNM